METEMLVSGDSNRQSHIGNGSSFDGKIEFHMARKPFSGVVNFDNKFQLETLNPTVPSGNIGQETKSATLFTANKAEGVSFGRNGFDPELSFGNTFRRIGAGLENLGNTCFLNSVLQCLTYTEPLVAYFQSGMHQSSCQTAGFCSVCAIQKHVSRALHATGRSLAPKDLVSNLRCISRTFRNARQEDAHEYMVHLLESMHRCCLPKGVPSESPSAYEKSLVHRIFGGRLQSQVRCMQCLYGSNKYDPFLDLSLEIAKADTLQKALGHFTAREELDGGAKQYQCQQCKQKVRAVKQLTIHDAPYVLTIHLKRFCAYDPRRKNDKKVVFSPTLDLKPFVSGSHEGSLMYTLYGVLVHAGWSTHSGHYYCFVRTSTGMWYNLDDNRVVQVNERTVLEQKAYMLFYVRDKKKSPPKKHCNVLNERMGSHANGNNIILSSTKDLKDVGRNGSLENHVDNGKSVTAAKEATDVKEIEGVSPIDSTTATSSATSKITLPDLVVSPLPKDTIVESRSEVVESLPPTGSCNNIEGSLGIGTVASNKENVPKEDVSILANILPDCSMVQHPENIKPVIDDKSQPPTGSCNNIEGSLGIGTVASNKENIPKEDVAISANILPDCSMVQHPENIKPVIDDKSQPPTGSCNNIEGSLGIGTVASNKENVLKEDVSISANILPDCSMVQHPENIKPVIDDKSQPPTGSCNNIEGSLGIGTVASNKENVPKEDVAISANILPDCSMVQHPENIKPVIDDKSQPPTGSCNNIEGSLGIGTVASNKENIPKEDVAISANILPDCSMVQHPENIKPVIDDKSQPPTGSCNNIEGSLGIGTVASNKENVLKEDVSISANILPDCSMVQHPENIKPVIDDKSQPPTGSCNNIEGSLGIGTVASNKENVPKEDVAISANILPDCSMVQHPENIKPVIDDKSQPPIGSCNNIEGSLGIGTVASNKENVLKEDVSISANILPDCSMVQHPENIKPVINDKSQLMVGEGCPLGVSVSSDSSKEEPESKIGSTVSAEQSVTLPVSSKTNDQVEILECSTTIKSKRRLVKPLIITLRLSTNFMCGSSARLCKKKFKQSRQTISKNKSCAQENLETVASTSETVSKSPPSRQKKRKSPSKEKLLETTASTSETVSKSPHSRLKKRKSPSKEKLLDPVKAELLSKNTPSKKTVGECGTRTDSGDVVLVANKPVKSMLSNEFKGGDVSKHCLHSGAEKISSLQTGLKRGLAEPIVARWDGTLSSNEHLISMTCESTRIGYVPDEWDEEYDCGKRKKVKLPKDSFDGRNPFQDLAAIKASFEKLRRDRSSSRNRPYRIARV